MSESDLLQSLNVFCPLFQETCHDFAVLASSALNKTCSVGLSICESAIKSNVPELSNENDNPFLRHLLNVILIIALIHWFIMFLLDPMINYCFFQSEAAKIWQQLIKSEYIRFGKRAYKHGNIDHAKLVLECLMSFKDIKEIDLPKDKIFLVGTRLHVFPSARLAVDLADTLNNFEETPKFAKALFMYMLGCLRNNNYDDKCIKMLKTLGVCSEGLETQNKSEIKTETNDEPEPEQETAKPESEIKEDKKPDVKTETKTEEDKKPDDQPEPAKIVTTDKSEPAKIEPETEIETKVKSSKELWNLVLHDIQTRSSNAFCAEKMFKFGDAQHARLLLTCLASFKNIKSISLPWEQVGSLGKPLTVFPDKDFFSDCKYGCLDSFSETPEIARAIFMYAIGCLRNGCYDQECIDLLNLIKPRASKAQQRWNAVLADISSRRKASDDAFFSNHFFAKGDVAHARLLLKCLLKFEDHKKIALSWGRATFTETKLTVRPDESFTDHTVCGTKYTSLSKFEESPIVARAIFQYAVGCLRNNNYDNKCLRMLCHLKALTPTSAIS